MMVLTPGEKEYMKAFENKEHKSERLFADETFSEYKRTSDDPLEDGAVENIHGPFH